jgi:hypothetical protein
VLHLFGDAQNKTHLKFISYDSFYFLDIFKEELLKGYTFCYKKSLSCHCQRRRGEKLESIYPTDYNFISIRFKFRLFVVAVLLEVGSGYLVWQWLKEKNIGFGLIGGLMLFVYGMIPTFQPSNFGMVYAAYEEHLW